VATLLVASTYIPSIVTEDAHNETAKNEEMLVVVYTTPASTYIRLNRAFSRPTEID